MGSAIETLVNREYPYGFVTDVETDTIGRGLNEDVIRVISQKKNEPEFMLEWRLKAYRRWLTMKEPHWPSVTYEPINYQDQSYYSAPKSVTPLQSLDEVDPELLRTYEKLGIPLNEQKFLSGVAVDAIFDSVSVGTTILLERDDPDAGLYAGDRVIVREITPDGVVVEWARGITALVDREIVPYRTLSAA